MKITLNGLEYPENIITFTNCPTILTMEDTWTGTKSRLTITVSSLSGVTDIDTLYYEIDGYRITATNDLTKSVGNKFYITSLNTNANKILVAKKICDALKSIGQLTVNYNIYQNSDASGNFTASVIVESRDYGLGNITNSTNIRSTILNTSKTNGSLTSSFNGAVNNKICVDVYKPVATDRINSSTITKGDYITTLEKNVWGERISFDLSSVFNTYTEFGDVSQFNLYVYSEVDNAITTVRALPHIFCSQGYLVNQGNPFIPRFNGCVLAQNVKRGATGAYLNNSLLYVYEPSIVLSIFADSTVSSMTISLNYLNGAMETIYTASQVVFAGNNLNTFTLNLSQVNLTRASYIDVIIPNLGTLRYNVIKPIHATEDCQRIYWTNSYGGTSFFDFTGNRTEERKTDIETYDKSLYDYYTSSRAELTQVYSKEVEITVTLTTHNIAKDGTWQLFDLQNSYNAWTVVNGKEYSIHITDIKIDETDVAGIYTGEIEYTYSMGDTF